MKRIFRRILAWSALAAALGAAHAAPHGDPLPLVYVGTQARAIHALRLDAAHGHLAAIGPVAHGAAATFALAHPRLPVLYAVDDDKERPGSVIAYAIDRTGGALAAIGTAPSGGNGTTFLALDASARTLFAANFGSGSASSIALAEDGRPLRLVSTVAATGSGPHRRQASAHAHGVAVDPSGRYALVPDLGADRVFVHAVDSAGALAPDWTRAFAPAPGSGPRQLVFAPRGDIAYLVNELSAEIVVLRWDARAGRLAALQAVPLSSPGFVGARSASALAIAADGRFVYAANRGENLLQVYRVQDGSGALELVQRIACGGETPWAFALHPSGRWLAVANQRSDRVNLFRVDPASGRLADTGEAVAVPRPVSIAFVD